MKKIAFLSLAFIITFNYTGFAQEQGPADRVITTAVPFLLVPGDARSAGMGDIGVVSSPDAFSQQWNAAKYAFATEQQGIGFSYVPYLRKLANDINVGQLNYYNRINERSAFAASIRYFNLGEIQARQNPNQVGLILKPNQISVDLSYALRLSENFSMGITGRYIRSDLKLQTSFEDASAANSIGVDISGYYVGPKKSYNSFDGLWRFGFNISNIGPKIKYSKDDPGSFLPTNLSVGGGFDFILDNDNTVRTYIEFNKLLVPTPLKIDYIDINGDGTIDGNERTQAQYAAHEKYNDIGAFDGIFKSLGDAPGGLKEELKEVTWALGAEYWFKDSFSFRAGYFHESPDKGYRQYFTLGAGFKYSMARINVSYLFSTAKAVNNPLEGSLRFSLSFNFGRSYQD